jgi:hypothetical protein
MSGMSGLDSYITGRWGEDSVSPEFMKAKELGDLELTVETWIDVAPQTSERALRAKLTKVEEQGQNVLLYTDELAHPLLVPEDALVYFADDED